MKNPDNLKPRTPFKEDLKQASVSLKATNDPEKFYHLDSAPGKIFRPMGRVYPETTQEHVREIKEVFKGLSTHGINIPQVDFVVGELGWRNTPKLIAMVDEIKGKNLHDMLDFAKSAKEKEFVKNLVQDLFLKLIEYIFSVEKNKSSFVRDLYKPADYMYGKARGDDKDKLYLIDLDPYFHIFSENDKNDDFKERDRSNDLLTRIQFFSKVILYWEERLGLRFDKIRKFIKEMLNTEPKNMPAQAFAFEFKIRAK